MASNRNKSAEEQTRSRIKNQLWKMTANNGMRIVGLEKTAKDRVVDAFRLIPILIHFNHPDVPGYLDQPDAPAGIVGFWKSDFAQHIKPFFPGIFIRELTESEDGDVPAVKSLLTIGSAGTVAYNDSSDFDYWVCLDRKEMDVRRREMMKEKLSRVTDYLAARYEVEANFYLVEASDLTPELLKGPESETEGEVAPNFLKDELYRTLLHVCGAAPAWWAAPPGVGSRQYRVIRQNLDRRPLGVGPELIDLGFPERPEPQEYLAAALWLSRKSEIDPFKGALKLILVLEQVENNLAAPLTSDQYKSVVAQAPETDFPVDPYKLFFRRVLEYADRRLEPAQVDLVRLSVYYKVRGPLNRSRNNLAKETFLGELVSSWGWTEDRRARFDDYTGWTEKERLELGAEMRNLLFHLYSRIARRLKQDYPDQVTDLDESLTELKARVLSRYSAHGAKVEDLPSHLHHKTLHENLTLIFSPDAGWELYGAWLERKAPGSGSDTGSRIYQSNRAARVAAWLVNNHLADRGHKIKIRPRPGPVGLELFLDVLDRIRSLLGASNWERLKSDHRWHQGGSGPRLAVINLEDTYYTNKLISADLIYRTAWGEMRHMFKGFDPADQEALKYIDLARFIRTSGETLAEDVHFLTPPGRNFKTMAQNMRVALAQRLESEGTPEKSRVRPSTTPRLDTE
jgi:adenylate cyclase class 1